MKGSYVIYNKAKQTKKDEHGVPQSTIATIEREKDTVVVSDKLSPEKQVNFILNYALFALASRVRAFVEMGKNLPSTLFVRVEIGGKIYSSETVVVKTKMESLIKISMKSLKTIPVQDVIDSVMNIHRSGLKSAGGHIARKVEYLAEQETGKISIPEYEGFLPEVPELAELN